MGSKKKHEQEGAVVTKERVDKQVRPPRMFKVLFHNDDYTTQQFVVAVLKQIFKKTNEEAYDLMMQVHLAGIAMVGIYPHEIAETKVAQTIAAARAQEYPFEATIEPAD